MTKRSELSIPGIYAIVNKLNGVVYIGQAINIRKRWASHNHYLARGNHRNCYLQRAWDKYGSENFEFTVLISLAGTPNECLAGALNEAEIQILATYPETYNLMEAGRSGVVASEATKSLLSARRKEMWADEELRTKRLASLRAMHADPEYTARRMEAVVDARRSPEARKRQSELTKLLWESPEHCEAMSAKRKANWQDAEYVANQKISRSATWADPEVRAKRSAAIRAAWARRKAEAIALAPQDV